MKTEPVSNRSGIDVVARILHLGLAVFGLLALVTGDLAGDYKEMGGLGFLIHSWIGRGIAFFIGLRVAYGMWGPADVRFANWVPYTEERIRLVWEDLIGHNRESSMEENDLLEGRMNVSTACAFQELQIDHARSDSSEDDHSQDRTQLFAEIFRYHRS